MKAAIKDRVLRPSCQRIVLTSILLGFLTAPAVILYHDLHRPTVLSPDPEGSDLQGSIANSEKLLSLRQEYYSQTYYQLKPVSPATQSVQTLHILPSFAKPQTLAATDGSIVFLEPEPFLHAPLDIVNHTADTALDHGRASSLRQASTARYRGQHIGMPQPTQALVQRSDLLVAITSAADRSSLIHASRGWRRGVRTLIALDIPNPPGALFQAGRHEHNESYAYYRDISKLNMTNPGGRTDDLRSAMTPFLANQSFGVDNYKWMLFGEDDTLFFVENALKLLGHLDHKLPYFLTDNIQYPQKHIDGQQYVGMHPNPRAPRCLPCAYADPLLGHYHNPLTFNATPACPCTQAAICNADNLWLTDEACKLKFNQPGNGHFFHKGAGAIISAGLMRLLSFEEAEDFLNGRTHYPLAESMLAELLWDKFRLFPTDPGYGYLRPHVRLFDPGWQGPFVTHTTSGLVADYGNDPVGLISRLGVALQGWCTVECEDQLQHTISSHLDVQHAVQRVDVDVVKGSGLLQNYTGPAEQTAAVYLHLQLTGMIDKYSHKQKNRQWFDMYEF